MLTVSSAASDFTLLTASELRAAVGLADANTSMDTLLATIGNRAANIIARECRVAQGGVARLTLKSETLAETVRLELNVKPLILSRRFVTAITSVVEDGVTLASTRYEVEGPAGLLWKLDADDKRISWSPCKLVVTYVAGFATVPDEIKAAAVKLVADLYSTNGANGNLKRERIEGISEREYWVPPTSDPAISAEVSELLSSFMSHAV